MMATEVEDKRIVPPVQRVVTVFSNATEELVTELPLVNFDLAKFKSRFQPGPAGEDESMYGCYEVRPEDVEFVSAFLAEPHGFNFDKFSYSVEAYVSDEDWAKYYSNARR
jgi:hypothetical protein